MIHRCRHLVAALVALAALIAARGQAQQAIWELRPYRCRVLIVADSSPRWSSTVQQRLLKQLPAQLTSWVGEAWRSSVEPANEQVSGDMRRAMATTRYHRLKISELARTATDSPSADKVFIVVLRDQSHPASIFVWEWDHLTATWSRPAEVTLRKQAELVAATGDAILRAFRPIARIEGVENGKVKLRGRASEISFRRPRLQPLAVNATLQICQSNAGLLDRGPLPGAYLVVDGKSKSFTTARLLGGYAVGDIAKTVVDGRWVGLQVRERFSRSEVQIDIPKATSSVNLAIRIRRLSDNQIVWRGQANRGGNVALHNSTILKRDQAIVHRREILAAGFVVDSRLLPVGWYGYQRARIDLQPADLKALADMRICRELLTEFSTRREIAVQRVKSRVAGKRKPAAAELLQVTLADEKRSQVEIDRRFATLPGKAKHPAVQHHWKTLSTRWSAIKAAKELKALAAAVK